MHIKNITITILIFFTSVANSVQKPLNLLNPAVYNVQNNMNNNKLQELEIINTILNISRYRSSNESAPTSIKNQLLSELQKISGNKEQLFIPAVELFKISFIPSLISFGGVTTSTSTLNIIAPKLNLLNINSTTTTTTASKSNNGATTTTTTTTSTTTITSTKINLSFSGSTSTSTTSTGGTTTTTTTSSAKGLGLVCSTSTSSSASGGSATATATLIGGFPLVLPGLPLCLF